LISIVVFGEDSLNNLLILSQIVLSLQLPFAVWPLIYFSSRKDIMTITFKEDGGTPYLAEQGLCLYLTPRSGGFTNARFNNKSNRRYR
jgi:Mn2+/Fe2+ NRAMP family transporter